MALDFSGTAQKDKQIIVAESTFAPFVVLVIRNNIYLIELISIQVKDFKMFIDWHGKG